MARINIEESLFKDVRFDDLKMKLGSVDTALGAMVRAWSLAQQWYLKEETSRLIPITEWKKQRISDFIIEVGLAEVRNDGVYVSGSESQFAWLLQRQSAGKKGGRPSNQNKEYLTKGSDKVPVPAESGSNPLPLPLPLPLPHSLIRSNTNNENDANANMGSIFELRMRFQSWEHFLKKKNIYDSRLGRGLDKISERFESLEKLESFIGEVISSPKTKTMNALELRKYIKGAIANETGLVKNA